jgi:hypothetical protein
MYVKANNRLIFSLTNFIRNSPGIIAGISLPIKFQEWQFIDHGHSTALGIQFIRNSHSIIESISLPMNSSFGKLYCDFIMNSPPNGGT